MKTKTIAPGGDRILLEIKNEEMTSGGIVVPATAQGNEKFRIGRVLAVGPGSLTPNGNRIRSQYQVGDAVLVDSFGCLQVKLDGKEDVFLARENDVLGRIEET